jgi:hypothetical protein
LSPGRLGDTVATEANQLDDLSRDYVTLAFGIERHMPGFVDAYFGPDEVKEAALKGEPAPAAGLLVLAKDLQGRIETGSYSEQRKGYLTGQVRGIIATCLKLVGEPLSYVEEVRQSFDIEPDHTTESLFDNAIAALDGLLPGSGDVNERMTAWRKQYEVPVDVARKLIDLISDEARRRTLAFVDLPAGEAVEFRMVQNEPWGGYNWYLGNAKSRVDINTDLPIRAVDLPSLITHEAYPGHHAEHVLKEINLYHEHGYGEHSIQLINTPECVISEGIATLSDSVIFTPEELSDWLATTIYPAAGITGDPEREAAIGEAQRDLRAVSANAALLMHDQGASEDEVVRYLMRYSLRTEEEATKNLSFIAHPLWRTYIFCYHAGRGLLGEWINAGPASERQTRFRTLLNEQVFPSQVRGWTER